MKGCQEIDDFYILDLHLRGARPLTRTKPLSLPRPTLQSRHPERGTCASMCERSLPAAGRDPLEVARTKENALSSIELKVNVHHERAALTSPLER
jgi:hypothetical protein